MNIDFQSTLLFLQQHDDFMILLHASPDGDTIGSGVALMRGLRKLSKRAFIACSDPIPARYDYLFDNLDGGDCFGGFEPKTILCVDIADAKLLGGKMSDFAPKIQLCIDHHGSNTLFAQTTYLDKSASATCEIIYHLLTGLGAQLDRHIADAVYTGIATDTGCFKFSNTTPETHVISAKLMEYGADYVGINRIMFDTKTRSRIEIERAALQNIEFHFDDRCAIICISRDMREETGADESELDGITSLPRQIEGVLVGVTIREREAKTYKISIRTHEPIDASALCARLGGGGHARAAGCELTGELSDVKAQILQVVESCFAE